MQYLLLAYDDTDSGAMDRRMKAREAHLAYVVEYKAKGHLKMGAALLDENNKMVGSSLLVDFPTQESLELWLENDPYYVQKVWKDITLLPCAIAPSFVTN